MSPTPAMVPSAPRAIMPETNTRRPLASMTVAWEKTPLGWRSRSVMIWRFMGWVAPCRSGEFAEQAAVTAHGLRDPERAQRIPERGRLAGDHGLGELALHA